MNQPERPTKEKIIDLVDQYADAFAAVKSGDESTVAGLLVAAGIKKKLNEALDELLITLSNSKDSPQ
jgi:hypothetical protein